MNVAAHDAFVSADAVLELEQTLGCHVVLVVGYNDLQGFVLFGARDADEAVCAKLVRWLNRNALKSR